MSESGVETDPDEISALARTRQCQSSEIISGLYWVLRFIKDYAKIIRPLNDLSVGHLTHTPLSKKKKKKSSVLWEWGEAQQCAFDTIKEKLSSPPVLAYADFSKPFMLYTDASTEGLDAVLYQVQGGQEKVIAYASSVLKNSEKHDPADKLEFLCFNGH